MATGTAFGPQGGGAVTSLPAGSGTNRYGSGVDTWVTDCSASGSGDGTVLDAAFFNMLLGNMRNVVAEAIADGASFTMTDGDMSLLFQAIRYFDQNGSVTVGSGLSYAGGVLDIDVPTLKIMVA